MAKRLRLSPRQQEVFNLLKKGLKLEAIARDLEPPISLNTLKKHVKKVFRNVGDEERCAIWRARYWAR